MGLKAYVCKRIVYMLLLMFFVASFNFLLFHMLPGSPLEQFIAKAAGAGRMTPEILESLKKRFGIGQPLHEKYFLYVRNMIFWEFGESYVAGASVKRAIMERLPNTLLLMGTSAMFSIIVGVLLGVIAAYKRGSFLDTATVTTALGLYSIPIFWIGWLILSFFAVQLRWFPVGRVVPAGFSPANIFEYIAGRLYCLALPAFTLFLFSFGGWILLTRACVLETITEDYVVTARAKGLKERTVLFKHVLKNASLPLVTSVALTFGFLISGAIITETVFAYGGMGMLVWDAITNVDIPVLQAFFYVIALLVIIANFIADLIYGVIDPRIKYG